jgi:SAM-dependent methyltransferase
MLGSLAELLPARSQDVLVDGPAAQAKLFAARLAGELGTRRQPVQVALDANRPRDVSIFLRTAPGGRHFPVYRKDSGDGAGRDARDRRAREERADIVIDLHDVGWPVIRRVAAPLAARGSWYLTETRAFFACRAATWDAKFGDDLPAYCAAVDEAGIRLGGVVVDVGCGTGALPPLRMAVGPAGAVIALVNHLPDTEAGLRELARVTTPGGLLVLFHPSGRAALAARHGHALSPDEPLAEGPLRRSTAATGWEVTAYDDAPHRFFAVAERR